MSSSNPRAVECEVCRRTVRVAVWPLMLHSVRHNFGVYSAGHLAWFATLQLVASSIAFLVLVGIGMSIEDAAPITMATFLIALLYGAASLAVHGVARRRRHAIPPPGAPR